MRSRDFLELHVRLRLSVHVGLFVDGVAVPKMRKPGFKLVSTVQPLSDEVVVCIEYTLTIKRTHRQPDRFSLLASLDVTAARHLNSVQCI